MKYLTPTLTFTAFLTFVLFFSCKKSNPSDPHEPPPPTDTTATDSTKIPNLKRGLLLYLPFNGNMADSSGNNNPTAAFNGATLTADEHGYANSAFGANGGGQTVQVTNNGSIQFDTAFTASLSVMTRDNSGHCYLTMTHYDNGHGSSFGLGTMVLGYPNFNFGVVDHTSSCDDWTGQGPFDVTDTTAFVPQTERWYNVVCTYHKGLMQTYVNGVLKSSKQGGGTSALFCPDSKIIVGGWWSQDIQNLNGVIDNVRLYNRVLLPEEIALLATHYQPNSNSVRRTAGSTTAH